MSYGRSGRKDNTFHCLPAHPQLQQGCGALQGMQCPPCALGQPSRKGLTWNQLGLTVTSAECSEVWPCTGMLPSASEAQKSHSHPLFKGAPKEKEIRRAAAKPQPQRSAPSRTACGQHYSIVIPTGLTGAALTLRVHHIQIPAHTNIKFYLSLVPLPKHFLITEELSCPPLGQPLPPSTCRSNQGLGFLFFFLLKQLYLFIREIKEHQERWF